MKPYARLICLSQLQISLIFIGIQILWVKMDARRILQIPSNTLELCVKVTRRHYSFTDSSFSFALSKLQSKFRTVPVNNIGDRLLWFQIEVCEIVFFPPLPPRPHWMKYCSESVLRRTDQGAIWSYIHPYTGKYSSIWLYTGPSRHLVSPAQDWPGSYI